MTRKKSGATVGGARKGHTCGRCGGDKACHRCWNQGQIPNPDPLGQVGGFIICPECGGKKFCNTCDGNGYV